MTTAIVIAIAVAVAVAAGMMRGFAGVGSGMLMAPIFAVLFGPIDTVTIIITLEIVVTAQLLPSVYREIDWRVVESVLPTPIRMIRSARRLALV